MALIAHWPLNGNMNDISGNGYNMSNNGATITDGKIGQAYATDGISQFFTSPNIIPNTRNYFTLSFWVYPISSGYIMTPSSYGIDHKIGYDLTNQRIYVGITELSDLNNRNKYSTTNSVLSNMWSHIAIIMNDLNIKIYINGVLNTDTTETIPVAPYTGVWYWGQRSNSTNWFNGKYNDIRVYNEILTDMEIQEISRAKILYYTFDDFQEPTTNMNFNPTPNTWVNSGAWTSNYNETDIKPPFSNANLSMWSGTVTTIGSIHFGFNVTPVSPSTTYTISVWYRQNRAGASGPYFRTSVNNNSLGNLSYNGNPNSGSWPVNTWIRISGSFTTQSNENGIYLSSYIGTQVGDKIWYYGYQVEKKSYPTEYVYGTRSALIRDYSGFFNDSDSIAEINSPIWISNAKIGSGAYQFNGSTSVIERPMLYQLGYNSFTVNMWAYFDESGTRDVIFGNFSSTNNFNIEKYTNNNLRFYWNASPDITTDNVLPIGQWCMITVVRDRVSSTSSTIKMYVNSIEIYNQTVVVNDLNSLIGTLRIGRDYRTTTEATKGKLDDIRVYTTALSTKDIKDLFEIRAEIEEKGTIYSKNFLSNIEETTNMHGDPTMTDQYTLDAVVTKSNWGVDGTLFARKNTAPEAPEGSLMLELNITSGSNGGLYTDLSRYGGREYVLEEGKTYTRSWWAKCSDTRSVSGHMCSSNRGDGNVYIVGGDVTVSPEWKKYSQTFTVAAGQGGLYHTRHIIYNFIFSLWVANFQIEEKPYYTPFTTNYREATSLPLGIGYSDNEIHETGTASFEDFSTVGIVDELVGYWPLKNNTLDYSGNLYNGTLSGSSLLLDSYNFDGIDDYITIPNGIDYTKGFSFSIFINPRTFGESYGRILDKTNGTTSSTNGFMAYMNNGPTVILSVHDTSISSTSIPYNSWTHLVGTVDPLGASKLYINGILNSSGNLAIPSNITTNNLLTIGNRSTNTDRSFDGFINSLKIFNKVLTPADVRIEYNTMFSNDIQIGDNGILYSKDLIQY